MCGGIKAKTSNPVFNALWHSKQHEGGKKMYGIIKITVCKKRNRCKNKDSEAGHSYNGLGSGKQCGGAINPSNEASKDTNCNGKQSKELHSGEIWRPQI